MSSTLPKKGGGQPWLGLRILIFGAIVMIGTIVDDQSHSWTRAVIVLLWVLTAFAAMLKEALAYGLGDRVTLFGMVLTVAISITALLIDHHPYSFVSLSSILFGFIMLRQVVKNVLQRQRAAAPWDGPG